MVQLQSATRRRNDDMRCNDNFLGFSANDLVVCIAATRTTTTHWKDSGCVIAGSHDTVQMTREVLLTIQQGRNILNDVKACECNARATLPATQPVGQPSNSNPNWSAFEFQPRLSDSIGARV